MAMPDRLLIPYEDFDYGRFNLVGRCGDGNQYMAFYTGAFPSGWWSGKYAPEYLRNCWPDHKRWYAVLHRFDRDGNHLETVVKCGGTTAEGQSESIERALCQLVKLLESLGKREPSDIWVKPFAMEIDGYLFGLIYQINSFDDPAHPENTYECVMLEPNDIMFHPPWDSGDYST